MERVDAMRFTVQLQLLRSAYRYGKKWMVFDAVQYQEGDQLFFFCCYAEAEAICLRNGKENWKIGELLALLRLLCVAPKQPYQWSSVTPVSIKRVFPFLTAIKNYTVEIVDEKKPQENFVDFVRAYQAFEKCARVGKQAALVGNWTAHPLGETKVVMYQTFKSNREIFQLLDPCETIQVNLIFFVRQHLNGQSVAYYNSRLQRVRQLTFGKWLNTDLFCVFEKS